MSGPKACGKVGAGLLRGAPRQQGVPTFGVVCIRKRRNVKDERHDGDDGQWHDDPLTMVNLASGDGDDDDDGNDDGYDCAFS